MHLNAFCAEDAEQGNTLTCLLSSSLGSHEYCGRSAVITNRGHFLNTNYVLTFLGGRRGGVQSLPTVQFVFPNRYLHGANRNSL